MEPNNSNTPVRVEFPREMKIHSPELDAVKISTRTIAEILSNHLKHIAEGIQSLSQLPNLFRELKTLVADQFKNLFEAQVETNIMNRQANIKVLGKKIAFVETHVGKKEEQLKKTNSQITNRFGNISKEMTNEHEFFLKKLDSHVYNITDQIYPKQVKERFSYDSQPNIDYLVNHAIESAYVRTKCISDSFVDAKREVENFLEERNILYEELSHYGIDTDLEEGYYNLPIWVAEILNNETGETETKIVYPWESISAETEYILEQMTDESFELMKNKSENNQILNEEMQKWLNNSEVPEKEILRFNQDCKHLILEEV